MSHKYIILFILVGFWLALLGTITLYEWVRVGWVANPEVLAQYPFGAEGPVAGNPAYASAEAYAHNALQTLLIAFGLLGVLVIAVRREWPMLAWLACALAVAVAVARFSNAL